MLGFQHEIYNALIHDDPVFSPYSQVHQQPHSPDAMIRCELLTNTGDLTAAVKHFYDRWMTELRYENPVVERLNLNRSQDVVTIHALTISEHNAMTFQFTIKRGVR